MARLLPPRSGVTVRMYRLGHGDCFLLAFAGKRKDTPYYVLIDCGYKPGSPAVIEPARTIDDIVADLHEACGGTLDLVILTHEHQDHLNGLWKANDPYFEGFTIREAWLAWTEDPDNALANRLRKRHRDTLLGLLGARHQLALAVGDDDASLRRIDQLLALEIGGHAERLADALAAASSDPEKSVNKQALCFIRDKAAEHRGAFYLSPGGEPLPMAGTAGVRAFVLGPPEDEDLIADEDPRHDEAFPREHSFSFSDAVQRDADDRTPPFRREFAVPLAEAFDADDDFWRKRYGATVTAPPADRREVPADADWRRIDVEWLYSAEQLALKLNAGINNTSLVIAFELPESRKVLLFAADAQRGNWVSWADVTFADGADTVTARDLLARTVLYKAGHHGSHNATLDGGPDDPHPNLAWMGRGAYAAEFTAMITAVNRWALEKNDPPWVHPLPSIKAALRSKARGKVLQTDEATPGKPDDVSKAEWARFTRRARFETLYFDLAIQDE